MPCPLRFQACAQKAWMSSMKLVSKVSDMDMIKLEAWYRKCCDCLENWETDELAADEMPEENAEDFSPGKECLQLLDCVRTEAGFVDPSAPLEPAPARDENADLKGMDDQENLKKMIAATPLTDDPAPEHELKETFMPTTLMEALDASSNKGDKLFWNLLLRLIVKLRNSSGGCDVGFLPNAWNCRRASRKLNWFQCLCCKFEFFGFGCVSGRGARHDTLNPRTTPPSSTAKGL